MYIGITSPPRRNTGVESKIGVWLVVKNNVAVQLLGTPSMVTVKVSATSSAGPGVGLDIVMLYRVCSPGSMVW